MSLDQLPFNLFDVLVIVVLITGIARGRKHGMSEELLGVLKWLTILFVCGAVYEPAGLAVAQFTGMFSQLTCFVMVYVVAALLVLLLFVWIKRLLGGKLLGSNIFGQSEYYLGMASGVVRFSCMLLAALALLNARYFSPVEVRAMEKYNDEWYGGDYFPGLHELQTTVFDKSLTGPWIKENLGFLLIKPTEAENKQLHQKQFVGP